MLLPRGRVLDLGSRTRVMTGRYPQRFGYEFNPDGSPHYGLPPTETTIAEKLRATGYRTALLGKWHLGSASRLQPLRRGFEEFYGFLGGDHSYTRVAGIDVGTDMTLLRSLFEIRFR